MHSTHPSKATDDGTPEGVRLPQARRAPQGRSAHLPRMGRRAEADLGMPPRTFRDYRDRLIAQRGVIKSATSDTYYLPA